MINIIIGYHDSNYTVTNFNGTIEEARNYYVNSIFNIEEKSVRAVTCEVFTEFKASVYKYCMDHEFLIVEFNDINKEISIVSKPLGLVTQNYTIMQSCIDLLSGATYDNYVKVANNEGLTSHQNLAEFVASVKLYKSEHKQNETDKNYMDWLHDHINYKQMEGF